MLVLPFPRFPTATVSAQGGFEHSVVRLEGICTYRREPSGFVRLVCLLSPLERAAMFERLSNVNLFHTVHTIDTQMSLLKA